MIQPLKNIIPKISPLACGCMGLGGAWDNTPVTSNHQYQAEAFVEAALASGITFFDHADIYTRGKAEQVFGEVLAKRSGLREQVILQSKCGIRLTDSAGPGRYDFSKEWIIASVEGSLKRLQTDYLDILLLHRPDALMEPEEVASAFEHLYRQGKVGHFGVSNMNQHQINWLQRSIEQPLIVNQLEINLSKLDWLNDGTEVNVANHCDSHFVPGLLEYSQQQGIQLQAWGCLSQGLFSGRDVADQPPRIQQTARLVATMAEELGVSREALVLAWIMRHPAGIQPVLGTTNPERIHACAEAVDLRLTREQWYQLYVSARGQRLP